MRRTLLENTSFQLTLEPEKKNIIDEIISVSGKKQGAVMVILNEIQEKIGYVSKPIQEYVARRLNVSASLVHGVVTFYSFFTTAPRGKHTMKFCMGTACYVGGTPQLLDKAKQLLNIEPGQTTSDGEVTLEICRCVGACSQAPVVMIDEVPVGRLKPSRIGSLINKFHKGSKEQEN
jgi:NADH-quinone oxidoreductase subunit E